MDIEVSQSVRIKDAQDTVPAFSNHLSWAILLPANVKRAAERHLKQRYRKPRNPELKIFAAGLYLLLRHHLSMQLIITIDQEWPGAANEATIKALLLAHVRVALPDFPKSHIRFARIGKGSRAHKKAYAVHRERQKAGYVVTEEAILELL